MNRWFCHVAIWSLLLAVSAHAAQIVIVDNPTIRQPNAEQMPFPPADDLAYRAGLSPFDYMCQSIACIDEARKRAAIRTKKRVVEGPPYRAMIDLPYKILLDELDKDPSASEQVSHNIFIATDYIYAFVPPEYIRGFTEERYRRFSVVSGGYVYRTFDVEVRPQGLRGRAICKAKAPRMRIPFSCVLIAILSGEAPLYRVIVGRASNNAGEFVNETYQSKVIQEVEETPKNELDLLSATPQWGFKSRAEFPVNAHCMSKWASAFADELATSKSTRMERIWFESRLTRHGFRYQGESPERESPMDSTMWEVLGVDVTAESDDGKVIRPEFILYGGTSRTRSSERIGPISFYQYYYSKIFEILEKAYEKTCR